MVNASERCLVRKSQKGGFNKKQFYSKVVSRAKAQGRFSKSSRSFSEGDDDGGARL